MTRSALLPLLAVLTAVTSSACLKGEAKTPADTPGLMMPPPPARTVMPPTIAPEEPVPTPPSPANSTAPPVKPDSPPPAARTTPPPVAQPPTPPSSSTAENPQIAKAAETPMMKELEGRVVKTLDDAVQGLEKLKGVTLSREATDQFNTAWSHVRAAKEALGIRNILHAQELANKALTLAKQLGGK